MSSFEYIKLPRLYVDQELQENQKILFDKDAAHYLKNVMRRKTGDKLRVFNGRHGEWLATIETLEKKSGSAVAHSKLKEQPQPRGETHLVFAPIKKTRMDFLIEKAVELGATHLHPVLTAHTEVRKINEGRIKQQIIEAAEQCERLDLPMLSPLKKLDYLIGEWPKHIPLYTCLERQDAPAIEEIDNAADIGFLIGPEGGFSTDESAFFHELDILTPVTLGDTIYRAETTAMIVLCAARHT